MICLITAVNDMFSTSPLEVYDFINVMVYDKTGIWWLDDIGPHSPYSYAEEAIQYWTEERNIAPDKITLGVPFYGFDFTHFSRSFQDEIDGAHYCSSEYKIISVQVDIRKRQVFTDKVIGCFSDLI